MARHQFEKGNKYATKNKGKVYKKTRAWEELGEFIIGEGAGRMMEIMKNSNDEKYAQIFKDMLNYFKPQQARNIVTGNITNNNITDFENWTPTELKNFLDSGVVPERFSS